MTVHIFNFCTLNVHFVQRRNFHCHYCNLQDEKLYKIYNIHVTGENKEIDYQLNFCL